MQPCGSGISLNGTSRLSASPFPPAQGSATQVEGRAESRVEGFNARAPLAQVVQTKCCDCAAETVPTALGRQARRPARGDYLGGTGQPSGGAHRDSKRTARA